jgi:hypothetical protein
MIEIVKFQRNLKVAATTAPPVHQNDFSTIFID